MTDCVRMEWFSAYDDSLLNSYIIHPLQWWPTKSRGPLDKLPYDKTVTCFSTFFFTRCKKFNSKYSVSLGSLEWSLPRKILKYWNVKKVFFSPICLLVRNYTCRGSQKKARTCLCTLRPMNYLFSQLFSSHRQCEFWSNVSKTVHNIKLNVRRVYYGVHTVPYGGPSAQNFRTGYI